MTGSIIPASIDAMIALFSGGSFDVIDGPGVTDAPYKSALFVGLGTTDSLDFIEAATTDQAWAWLGHNVRDETAFVHCLAESWNGDADMKAARDTVFGTLTTVTTTIQNNADLNATVMYVVGIKASSFMQTQDAQGALAQLKFDIQLRGRES